jgi:hypothetical protein
VPEDNEGNLIEMRCRSCGMFLGVRRRTGPFIFWCSQPCADTVMAKTEETQLRSEVAVELYLGGKSTVETARFIEIPYTRVQQLMYQRGISLPRAREKESA